MLSDPLQRVIVRIFRGFPYFVSLCPRLLQVLLLEAPHRSAPTPAARSAASINGRDCTKEPDLGTAQIAVESTTGAVAVGKGGSCCRWLSPIPVPHSSPWPRFQSHRAEETDHPREVIEAALAHVVQNKVEAAYAGSDLFERRRLMDDWAAYLE